MLYLANIDSITSTFNTQEAFSKLDLNVENIKNNDNNNNNINNDNNADNPILNQNNKSMLNELTNFKIQPLPSNIDFYAEPMSLQSMPVNVPAQIHIVSALDPENIYFRLCSWVLFFALNIF